MVKFTNEIAKRCVRWILLDTSPAPLAMLHPVRDDMAAAADEIARLEGEVRDRITERDYHLRMADKLSERLAEAKTVLNWLEERAQNSTSYGSHCHAYEVAAKKLLAALAPSSTFPSNERGSADG